VAAPSSPLALLVAAAEVVVRVRGVRCDILFLLSSGASVLSSRNFYTLGYWRLSGARLSI
jgi:hypothetical protein